jgi:hypothetical protein
VWVAVRAQPRNQREKLAFRLASCWKPELAPSISGERAPPSQPQPSERCAIDRRRSKFTHREGVENDSHFACDTFLWSAYNVSVAADAAKAWWQMASLWKKDELSSGFMHSNECFNAK